MIGVCVTGHQSPSNRGQTQLSLLLRDDVSRFSFLPIQANLFPGQK